VVVGIEHVYAASAIVNEGPGIVQLSWFAAAGAPTPEGLARDRKFLHAMIPIFAYVNVPLAVQCQIVRIVKLAEGRSGMSPNLQELTIGLKDLNAVVTRVGHPKSPVTVQHQILRPEELSWL
jgi:hypothetical protein